MYREVSPCTGLDTSRSKIGTLDLTPHLKPFTQTIHLLLKPNTMKTSIQSSPKQVHGSTTLPSWKGGVARRAGVVIFLFPVFLFTSGFACAQTTYTWTGTTDTLWTTSTNWSPNGVPDSASTVVISDQSNDPALTGNIYIRNLTLNSGTFDLNYNTLEVEQSLWVYGGTITEGLLYARQAQQYSDVLVIQDAILNCKVDIRTPIATLESCVYNDSVRIDQYGGWTQSAGDNIFNDHLHYVQSGGPIRFGNTVGPDSIRSTMLAEIESTASNKWWYCGTQGVYFGDDVTIHNHSNQSLEITGHAYFDGDITIGVKQGYTGRIELGENNYGVTISDGHSLKIDPMGFGGGTLQLYDLTQEGSATNDLSTMSGTLEMTDVNMGGDIITPDSVSVKLYGNSSYAGVDLEKVTVWQGATFNGKVDMTTTSVATGGNVFKDTVHLTCTTGQIMLGYSNADTALAPFTLVHNGTMEAYLNFRKAGSYFADDLTITNNNSGDKWLFLGYSSGATTTYDGDITLNQTDGKGIRFLGTSNTVNGGIRTGSAGFTTGRLYFSTIDQTSNDSIVLNSMPATSDVWFTTNCDLTGHMKLDGGKPYMYQATFNGGASVTAGSIPPTYCHFGGDTYFTKTGTTNNLTKGNYYGGDLTVTNESNTNYLYLGYSAVDTVLGDVTLTNNGTALLWFASNTKTPIYGDLDVDGTGEIRFGHPGAGDYLAFEGSGNQSITIGDSITHRAYRMLVDKPSGHVILKDSLVIDDELKVNQGRVICQEDGMVTIWDAGVFTGVSDSTYVEGPVKKVGNDAFDFPVGRNGLYRPISITAPSATTDEFVAEYFESNSDDINAHSVRDASLAYMSSNEYWAIDRTFGTSTPTATIGWDSVTSCVMKNPLAGIHIAGWSLDSLKWEDLGNGETTGDTIEGTITTGVGIDEVSMLTLASDSLMTYCSREVSFTWLPNDSIFSGDTVTFTNTSSNFPSSYSFVWDVDNGLISGFPGFGDTLNYETSFERIFGWGQRTITLYAMNPAGILTDSAIATIIVYPANDEEDCNCTAPDCEFVGNGQFASFIDAPITDLNSSYYADCWTRVPDDPVWEGYCPPIYATCETAGELFSWGLMASLFSVNSSGTDFSIPSNLYSASYNVYEPGLSTTTVSSAYGLVVTHNPSIASTQQVRTYLFAKMQDAMNSGQRYQLSFFARLSQRSSHSSRIQVGFTLDEFCETQNTRWIQQSDFDELQTVTFDQNGSFLNGFTSWHECSEEFTANDDWEWMYLGNFDPYLSYPTIEQANPLPFYVTEMGTGTTYPVPQAAYFIDNISITAVEPIIDQGESTTICENDLPLTLSASASGDVDEIYHWSSTPSGGVPVGQENQQSISVSPNAGITTYTVTVYGPNGCELTDEIQVTVNEGPEIQYEFVERTCIEPSLLCLSGVTSQDSVVWTVPSGIQWSSVADSCISVSDWDSYYETGAWIHVEIHSPSTPCPAADSLWVSGCCLPDSGAVMYNDTTIVIPTSTTTTISGAVSINGALIIDGGGDLILSDAAVNMGPEASIVIQPGSGLIVEDATRIEACDSLYTGIVGDSCRLRIHEDAHIQDAWWAVLIDNPLPQVYIDTCTFDKNFVHVALLDDQTLSRTFTRVQMTCTQTLQPPLNGQNSHMGFYFYYTDDGKRKNVVDCVIEDAANGVYSYGGSLVCRRDTIRNMQYDCSNNPTGSSCYQRFGNGIFIDKESEMNSMINVIDCQISNCRTGVRSRAGQTGEWFVKGCNIFDNEIGISAQYRTELRIYENDIDSNLVGIMSEQGRSTLIYDNSFINNGFAVSSRFDGPLIDIYDNTFNWPTTIPHWYGHGIRIEHNQTRGLFNFDAYIHDNTFSDAVKGIFLGTAKQVRVHDNRIHVQERTSNPLPHQESRGIYAQNSARISLHNNRIWSDAASNTWKWWDTGIRTSMCAQMSLVCDTTSNIHNGYFFIGPANSTWMIKDVMDSTHLRGIMQGSGALGQQGTNINPTDVEWKGTFAEHTETLNGQFANLFYVREGVAGSDYNPSSFNAASTQNDFLYEILPVEADPGYTAGTTCPIEYRNAPFLQRVALDSITYSGPDSVTVERLSKLELYRAVRTDSILALDSILNAFVDSFAITDLGTLDTLADRVSVRIPKSTSAKYSTDVGNVVTTDTIGALWQEMLQLAFDKWADDDTLTVFSAGDSTRLWNVAGLCPTEFGPSVYMARTMLLSWDSTYFALGDSCEIPPEYVVPSGRLSSPDQEANVNDLMAEHEETRVWVFPNPTQNTLQVRSSGYADKKLRFHLTGVDGRNVMATAIMGIGGTVSLDNVDAGMYLLRIYTEDGAVLLRDNLIVVD